MCGSWKLKVILEMALDHIGNKNYFLWFMPIQKPRLEKKLQKFSKDKNSFY
jgi:hypothetical protein